MTTCITFTKVGELLAKIKPSRYTEDGGIQHIILVNEKKVIK